MFNVVRQWETQNSSSLGHEPCLRKFLLDSRSLNSVSTFSRFVECMAGLKQNFDVPFKLFQHIHRTERTLEVNKLKK